MSVGLLGRKVGMTQVYDANGRIVPVTVIQAGPCTVLQVKTKQRDGYEAVQLGYLDRPREKAPRSARGHVAQLDSKRRRRRAAAGVDIPPKADCEPKRFIREFRTDGEEHGLEVGQEVTVSLFAPPEPEKEGEQPKPLFVDVIGTSKGRGTAGVMKRHNFGGQRDSHGVKRVHRHPGSIGQSADPSRVLKGTRMAGRYGNARTTVRHLQVIRVDEKQHMLVVKGAIPGPNGGFVVIRPTNKRG